MSNDDNKCAKCGKYSGGSTTCNACQKKSLPKKKKPAPKKGRASPVSLLGYFHNWALHSTTEIIFADSDPSGMDTTWYGPFRTWQAAKRDALYKARWERDSALAQMTQIRGMVG